MEASDISGDIDYTHIHFAFANLTQNYEVDLGDQQIQFQLFLGTTQYKRIISFGGWAFSTDPSTYNIFCEGVTVTNRGTLVTNIVNFVKQYGLDGADIDLGIP
jgi:GH18 family chitinase